MRPMSNCHANFFWSDSGMFDIRVKPFGMNFKVVFFVGNQVANFSNAKV